MAEPKYPHFVLVALLGGHSWEVRGDGMQDRASADDLFGTIAVSEDGYRARTPDGAVFGPFTTLDEAAYPLALEAEGRPRTAHLLLGDAEVGAADEEDGGRDVTPPPVDAARRPGRRRRILFLLGALMAGFVLLLALPTPRTRRSRERRIARTAPGAPGAPARFPRR